VKENFFRVFGIFFEALSLHCKPPNENAALRAAFFCFNTRWLLPNLKRQLTLGIGQVVEHRLKNKRAGTFTGN